MRCDKCGGVYDRAILALRKRDEKIKRLEAEIVELRQQRDRAESSDRIRRAEVAALRSRLTERRYEHWEGLLPDNHRTVGYRAWCFKDGAWCYPHSLCECCADGEIS